VTVVIVVVDDDDDDDDDFLCFCFIVTKRKDFFGVLYLPYTLTTRCIFLGQRWSLPTHRLQRKHHIVSLLLKERVHCSEMNLLKLVMM
jgi:hypothetical protein